MSQQADPILANLSSTNLSTTAVVHNGIAMPAGTLTLITIGINAAAVGSYVFTIYKQTGTSGTFSSLTTVTITNGNWTGNSGAISEAVVVGDTLRVALTTLPAGQTCTAPVDIVINWTRTIAADTAVTLSDGDKGDVSVSSGTITIDNDAVTFAKMQNIATDSLIGRDTASTGDAENILLNATLEMDGTGNLRRAALTGDVTATAGSNSTTIANEAVTYAKMQNVSAASKLLGRGDSGSGDVQEITLGTGLTMTGTTLDAAGSGDVATDAIWDAKGDLAVGTGANTAQKLTVGTNGHILYADSAETTGVKWDAPPSGTVPFTAASGSAAASLDFAEDTDNGTNKITVIAPAAIASDKTQTFQDATGTIALTANKLSDFAATSSAELATNISDETGSGALVFGTAPTIANPKLTLTAAHGSDDTYFGTSIPGLNNSGGVTQWDTVYLNSSSQWVIADANGSGTYPALGLAVSTETTGNPVTVLVHGTARNDAWNWTIGGLVYLSTTPGGLTQTAPSTSGDKVQIIGIALTADIIFVNPELGYLTIT